MSNIARTEVLITGAGPVGMLTALRLNQLGVVTRIIDQESRVAGHSYSCALHPRSLQILQEVGLAHDAIKAGYPIDTVGFYAGGIRRAELKFSELPVEFPFALVLEQCALEKLLENKLRAAGVPVQWNHRLADLDMAGAGVSVTVEKLGTTGKGYVVPDFESVVEKRMPAEAQFVVGADGARSIVRRRLNIPARHCGVPQHFAVYELAANAGCGNEARVVLDDRAASVLWPISEKHCRWGFQITPDKPGEDFPEKDRNRLNIAEHPSERDNLHHLQRFLVARAPWFKQPVAEVRWAADVQFEPWAAEVFGKNRCWLAGDAAHQTSPVGVQSMNIGFREAFDLADILDRILHNGRSMDLLQGYDTAHRAEWQRLFEFKPANAVSDATPEWVRRHADQVVSSIPASGADLTILAKSLGLDF